METLILHITNKANAVKIKEALGLFKGIKSVKSADAENESIIKAIKAGRRTSFVPEKEIMDVLK